MDHLENAAAITDQIRDVLEAEVEQARAERALIRTMDTAGLMRRAAARAEFNAAVARRQAQLSEELAAAAKVLGLGEVTLDRLRAAAPLGAQRLADSLAEVRALAAALAELDDLNRLLGQRALSYVRSYLGALNPTPSAYDRRGAAASPAAALGSRAPTLSRTA
jgi:ABC-type transporter Mla subunit MlaD